MAAIVHLVSFGDLPTAAARAGLMVFGVLYVAVLLTPLVLLKKLPEGHDWIFLILTRDLVLRHGRLRHGPAAGRHKLYRAISPGKSVEGALGGLCFSASARRCWPSCGTCPSSSWVDVG